MSREFWNGFRKGYIYAAAPGLPLVFAWLAWFKGVPVLIPVALAFLWPAWHLVKLAKTW